MRLGIFFLILGAIGLMCAVVAEKRDAQWIGVWEGQLDGQPGLTVTLGRDSGDVQGTIVFNVVARENGEARVIGHDAHVLTHVSLGGDTLAFHVIRLGDARKLHLTMRRTNERKAVLECSDCGGPKATELQRLR